MRPPGSQPLNLAKTCSVDGGVYHETIHALGFDHEHNRHDRDKYLTVNFNNVAPGWYFIYYEYSLFNSLFKLII